MRENRPLKSAYELAMERLRQRDREEGVEQSKALDANQKKEIARLRQESLAKLAELRILHDKNRREAAADPKKAAEIDEHYEIDRRRVESALESALERVRRGESPS